MLGPRVQLTGSLVTGVLDPGHGGLADVLGLHGDASLDGTDEAAQVAPDAVVVLDPDLGASVLARLGTDGLMGAVLAGDVAQATADALLLVDGRLDASWKFSRKYSQYVISLAP